MNIAIIGAGNIGATLTRRLTAIGHHVRVANSRGPETLTQLAQETGAQPVGLAEIAHGAELVIVALPQKAIVNFDRALLSTVPLSVPVIDTGNYVPTLRDGHIEELDNGTVESRWVQAHLAHPVVKAFNSITAQHLLTLGRTVGDIARIALPVAGDDPSTKAKVLTLVDELGFDPIDAGGLDESWRQQPGTPVYATDLDAAKVHTALAQAEHRHTHAWRNRLAAQQPVGER